MYKTLALLFTLLVSQAAFANEQQSMEPDNKGNTYTVIEKKHSFFDSLWSHLKQIMPRKTVHTSSRVAVLGVRGSETTESALVPHWEGDLTKDRAFQNKISLFQSAVALCESDEKEKGIMAFESLSSSGDSAFISGSFVGMAGCYSKMGKEDLAKKSLSRLVHKYPNHPMAGEIKSWISKVSDVDNVTSN